MTREAQRLIGDFRRRKQLHRQLILAKRRAERANRLVDVLDQRLRDVIYIKEVYKGVPLEYFGKRISSPCTGRKGEYWKNRHTNRHWGLSIEEPDTGWSSTLGIEWPTERSVIDALREWVACGVRPVMPTTRG